MTLIENKKTALILGGSTGMGKATAAKLLKSGIAVRIVARDLDKLHAAQAELSSLGPVTVASVDLYDRAAVERFAE